MAQYLGFFWGLLYSFHNCFLISNFFDLSTTEVVEMRIWCIKIDIVLVLHINLRVEAPDGGLQVPEGLYIPVAKFFGICLKVRIWIKLSWKK
jgi:hypothetical protein